jgi:hypothetical protein
MAPYPRHAGLPKGHDSVLGEEKKRPRGNQCNCGSREAESGRTWRIPICSAYLEHVIRQNLGQAQSK